MSDYMYFIAGLFTAFFLVSLSIIVHYIVYCNPVFWWGRSDVDKRIKKLREMADVLENRSKNDGK